jgi:hypothetical protein
MTANTIAAALEMTTGKPARAVCVWCLNAHDPHEQSIARRIPNGGDCSLCSYSDDGSGLGSELFVAILPGLDACPVQTLTIALVETKLARIS